MIGASRATAYNAIRRPTALSQMVNSVNTGRLSADSQRRNFFTIIQQGHEGWRLTLGRSPVKLDAGLSLMLPLIHTVHEVDMRETSVSP